MFHVSVHNDSKNFLNQLNLCTVNISEFRCRLDAKNALLTILIPISEMVPVSYMNAIYTPDALKLHRTWRRQNAM